MKKPNPKCIVCGKSIRKRVTDYWFKLPREACPGSSGPIRVPPKPATRPGDRETPFGGGIVEITVAELPKDRAEAQRYVNGEIVSSKRTHGLITAVGVWDGERYHSDFFCTNACAMQQGYASAQHGARFKWKDPE